MKQTACSVECGSIVAAVERASPGGDCSDSDWQELRMQKLERESEEFDEMRGDDARWEAIEYLSYLVDANCPAHVGEVVTRFGSYLLSGPTMNVRVSMDFELGFPTLPSPPTTGTEVPADLWTSLLLPGRPLFSPGAWQSGGCFRKLCKELGVEPGAGWTSPRDVPLGLRTRLASCRGLVAVTRTAGVLSGPRNHVFRVGACSGFSALSASSGLDTDDLPLLTVTMPVAEFFDPTRFHFYVNYYANTDEAQFGELRQAQSRPGPFQGPLAPGPEPPGSVADEEVRPGSSNISGGVVRRARRKVNPRPSPGYTVAGVARNYNVSASVEFNNVSEMTLDAVSAEYAQEILEEVFGIWGLPFEEPKVMKYAEDLVFTFLVASTASDKADYNRAYDLPVAPGGEELVANFKTLSDTIVVGHSLTRRQFARGLADRVRMFVKAEENGPLRATLADRAGSHYQYGDLCFDGSTHCSGLTPTERAFTRTLEARNLFESDAVLATGASDRLLTGFSQRRMPQIAAA